MPYAAPAKNHERHEHHHRRSSIYFEFGSGYHRPSHYYYDQWDTDIPAATMIAGAIGTGDSR